MARDGRETRGQAGSFAKHSVRSPTSSRSDLEVEEGGRCLDRAEVAFTASSSEGDDMTMLTNPLATLTMSGHVANVSSVSHSGGVALSCFFFISSENNTKVASSLSRTGWKDCF